MQEIYFIVNCGLGSKLLKKAKKLGMRGGTILRAHGTIENSLLHLFALDDQPFAVKSCKNWPKSFILKNRITELPSHYHCSKFAV